MRFAAGTVVTALVALSGFAASAMGAGWVGPTALPGATGSTLAFTAAITRTGWTGADVSDPTPGTEDVLLRDPSGTWTSSPVTGLGALPIGHALALSDRGDAVLAVVTSAGQVLVFGHAAGAGGFALIAAPLGTGGSGSALGAVALEDGTVAVAAGSATDVVLATGPVGGPLTTQDVLPAGATAPQWPTFAVNPRGDAVLMFVAHTAVGPAERLFGLHRAPGGAFAAFPAALDAQAGGLTGSASLPSVALDDSGAAEVTWLANTNPGPVQHLRAGHLPAGATALSTANRLVYTTGVGEQLQGPIGAVPLPGDGGAGVYELHTASGNTIYDIAHAGAADPYTATATTLSLLSFFVLPDPQTAGGMAVAGFGAGATVVASERQANGSYVAGPVGPSVSSIAAPHTDGVDSVSLVNGASLLVFDAAPPTLGAPAGPATAVVGHPATFSVAASDASGPPALSWTLGDGGAAAGATITHTWAAAGIVVTPAPPAKDTIAPKITGAKLSPSSVHRKKAKTTLKLTLSEAAKVTVTVTAKVAGHRSGKKCKPGKPHSRSVKSCKATKTVKTIHKSLAAGAGSVAIRLSKSVTTGTLTVKAVAIDAAGNTSPSTTLHLKVKR